MLQKGASLEIPLPTKDLGGMAPLPPGGMGSEIVTCFAKVFWLLSTVFCEPIMLGLEAYMVWCHITCVV